LEFLKEIIHRIVCCISEIHNKEMAHGDIKISNILVQARIADYKTGEDTHQAISWKDRRFRLVLADLGQARWTSDTVFGVDQSADSSSHQAKKTLVQVGAQCNPEIEVIEPISASDLAGLFVGKTLRHAGAGTPGRRQPGFERAPAPFISSSDLKRHDLAGDVWSLGVMCYLMVTGRRLGCSSQILTWEKKLHQASQDGTNSGGSWFLRFAECDLPPTSWKVFENRFRSTQGQEAQNWKQLFNLLEGMLCYDLDKRSTAESLILHPFFSE
jgi:serine/threonine protein kinase